MAYIHKETFEILNHMPEDWKVDYFECDELIAPVIRVLNLKGYKTKFCCAGHAYCSLNEAEFKSLKKTKKTPKKSAISGTYYMKPREDGWYYVKYKSFPERGLYISFEPGTVLPEPPKGFTMSYEWPKGHRYEDEDGNECVHMPKLEKDFSNKPSDYSFYRLLLAALRLLLEWAEFLPDLTGKPE